MTILTRWFLILLLFVLVVAWNYVAASPIARASDKDVLIVLYDDKCALDILGLPQRAQWSRGGKSWEDCFDVRHDVLILIYLEDKSIVIIPVGYFKPHGGI